MIPALSTFEKYFKKYFKLYFGEISKVIFKNNDSEEVEQLLQFFR